MTVDWKSANKLTALCPGSAKEGKGDIIIATMSGGLGSCSVQLRVFKETVGPLKEVAAWTQEKFYNRRKNRVFSPAGVEHDDALGLSVEGTDLKIPEERLQNMFPGKSGDIGAENFDPAYYLLENHHGTNFEDLQAGLGYLKRRVDGENESQLSFIKANVSSIMDQLDTMKSIRKR
jgi:exocyst complex component 2